MTRDGRPLTMENGVDVARGCLYGLSFASIFWFVIIAIICVVMK
jgi:hypothetical protein